MEKLINTIKNDFETEISRNNPLIVRLNKLIYKHNKKYSGNILFEPEESYGKKEKDLEKQRQIKQNENKKEIETLKNKIEDIKSNKIYENAFEWRFEFPEVLNDNGEFIGFDIVIGNPPYFQIQYTSYSLNNYLDQYKTYEKTGDIYSLFFERSLSLCKLNGLLSFITSNRFCTTNYGESTRQFLSDNKIIVGDIYSLFFERSLSLCKLNGLLSFITSNRFCTTNYGESTRQFLSDNKIIVLININNIDVFDEANVSTLVSLIQNIPYKKDFKVNAITIDSLEHLKSLQLFSEKYSNYVYQEYFNNKQWVFKTNEILSIKNKIESNGIPLKDITELKINRGITTGANHVFIIDKVFGDKLINQNVKNSEIIKPVLKGAEIKPYLVKDFSNYIILSKTGIKIENFPEIYEYLKGHESDLKTVYEAKKGMKKWYELRKCKYYDSFEKEKLIWTRLSDTNAFAISNNKEYSIDSTSFAIGKNLQYYCAILNSKVVVTTQPQA